MSFLPVFPCWRKGARIVAALATAAFCASHSRAQTPLPPESKPAPAPRSSRLTNLSELNLGAEFEKKMRQRSIIDRYGAQYHAIEGILEPAPADPGPRLRQNERLIRIVRPRLDEETLHYRLTQGNSTIPLRGFAAPILEAKAQRPRLSLPPSRLAEKERQAAETIRASLAHDGLLATLAKAIEILGPRQMLTNSVAAQQSLRDLGFPVDLLRFFRWPSGEGQSNNLIAAIARRLADGESVPSLQASLRGAAFSFQKSHPDFRVAEETGEFEIGMIRAQIGGGYRNGVIPGGSLAVSGKLVAALPEANFVFSVPEEFAESVRTHALLNWLMGRRIRVTMIPEKTSVAPWAQDNGKAGILQGASGPRLATLAPRFASKDEVNSVFDSGESYLMDGLAAAGHAVIHSPLLFQGGNMLAARDPASGKRVLFVAETVIRQNMALGLTQEQASESFRIEFGVDECVILPAVSYHLDYDVTLRAHEGRGIAFVNDIRGASRLIIQRGFAALVQGGILSDETKAQARQALAEEQYSQFAEILFFALQAHRAGLGAYSARVAALFSAQPTDSPAFNFQCFLAALDFWRSSGPPEPLVPRSTAAREYLTALRDLEAAGLRQQEEFRKRGWEVVSVPSMPDLHESLNYLNGIHDRAAFYMPALGGFYRELDDAAAAVFQRALGPSVKIFRIVNTELQRLHGGIHCAAAVYPRFGDAPRK